MIFKQRVEPVSSTHINLLVGETTTDWPTSCSVCRSIPRRRHPTRAQWQSVIECGERSPLGGVGLRASVRRASTSDNLVESNND